MESLSWTEHLDQLEEWVRRADDPDARPPSTDPEGAPTGPDLLRAKALLAAMADRETELRRERDGVERAELYHRV